MLLYINKDTVENIAPIAALESQFNGAHYSTRRIEEWRVDYPQTKYLLIFLIDLTLRAFFWVAKINRLHKNIGFCCKILVSFVGLFWKGDIYY